MIIGFFAILIWLVRMASIMVVNILITIRFIQLYLMIPLPLLPFRPSLVMTGEVLGLVTLKTSWYMPFKVF